MNLLFNLRIVGRSDGNHLRNPSAILLDLSSSKPQFDLKICQNISNKIKKYQNNQLNRVPKTTENFLAPANKK